MTTFTTPLASLVDALKNGSAARYALETWGRSLNVKSTFKHRIEVNLSELPLIMITVPQVEDLTYVDVRDFKYQLRMYCGFHQPSRDLGVTDLVAFDEALDDDLVAINPATIGLVWIKPRMAVTDEGYYHPVYFMVKNVEVYFRRIT